EPRQQQVEDDELVRLGETEPQAAGAVLGAVDRKALGLAPKPQELEDPRFVLDDQDPHGRASRRVYNPSQDAFTSRAPSFRLGDSRSEAVARVSDGLDRRACAELAAQPADRRLEDVRARRRLAPDVLQKSFAADDLAGVLGELLQELELAIRQIDRRAADASLVAGRVEHQIPHADQVTLGLVAVP